MKNRYFSLALLLTLFMSTVGYAQQLFVEPPVQTAPEPTSLILGNATSSIADGEYECLLTFRDGETHSFNSMVVNGFLISALPSSIQWPANTDLVAELFELGTSNFVGYGYLASNSGSISGTSRPMRLWPIVLTDERRTHILDGDPVGNGGGHGMGRGKPGKSEFTVPDDWAIDIIINVATDPSLTWVKQNNGRIRIEGYSFPHFVEVILEADGKTIVTGYPTDVPRNPNN